MDNVESLTHTMWECKYHCVDTQVSEKVDVL